MADIGIITGTHLLGACLWIFAVLFLARNIRNKQVADEQKRSFWTILLSIMLLCVYNLTHFVLFLPHHSITTLLSSLHVWVFAILTLFSYVILTLLAFSLFRLYRCKAIDVEQEEETLIIENEEVKEDAPDDALSDVVEERIKQWVSSRQYINANITVKDALNQMGITAHTLNYYLESNTSVRGYRQWLPYLRVEEAKKVMLKHPEYNLQAVAEACGYANSSNLSRSFKQQEGIPPFEWFARQQRS